MGEFTDVSDKYHGIAGGLPEKESTEKEMDFFTALKVVANGGRVARVEWEDKVAYVSMKAAILSIKRDGKFNGWMVSEDDLEAKDWRIWVNGRD